MGMAYAYRKGNLKMEPSDEIKQLAGSMNTQQLRDFASTKHRKGKKELPEHVAEKAAAMIDNRRFDLLH